ncbi:Sorting nexin mvp1 [Microbotryomycetes sp. JL221]|nr:Sorting nexin mvp1 [Microbotryomycetes sp. JL221]
MSGPLDVSRSPTTQYSSPFSIHDNTPQSRQTPVRQASSSSWDGGASPWGRPVAPTLKQQELNDMTVPAQYVQAWHQCEPVAAHVSLDSLKQTLNQSKLDSTAIDKILNLTVTSPKVNQSTFFMALGLLSRIERGQTLSIEAVVETANRGTLTVPMMLLSSSLTSTTIQPSSNSTTDVFDSTTQDRHGMMKSSFDPPEYFPGHSTHDSTNNAFGQTSSRFIDEDASTNGDGIAPWSSPIEQRTTPFFNNNDSDLLQEQSSPTKSTKSHRKLNNNNHDNRPNTSSSAATPTGAAEGSFTSFAELGFVNQQEDWKLSRPVKIDVRIRDEMAGFVFKHNVWFIVSETGTTVERRYSDFVWLLQCLTKRYPFRSLPNLPPKHLQLGGNHVLTDDLFLERRRRGLQRFLSCLSNHPVVKHDGLLNKFLNEQGDNYWHLLEQKDLSSLRKSTNISLQEEFYSKTLSRTEQESIPIDLDNRLSNLRSKILNLIEQWSKVVSAIDRIAHRRQNQSVEWEKLKEGLMSCLEVEQTGWRFTEVNQVERDERLLSQTSQTMATEQGQSAKIMIDTIVEEVKRHRELYINFRDLFARHMTLAPDAVDKLRRRTEMNLRKLRAIKDAAATAGSSGSNTNATTNVIEFDKLTSLIEQDQRQVDLLLKRRVFIRWCMWQELIWLFRSTSLIKLTIKDLVQRETEFADVVKHVWLDLQESLEVEQDD